jgi:hypothetical protein
MKHETLLNIELLFSVLIVVSEKTNAMDFHVSTKANDGIASTHHGFPPPTFLFPSLDGYQSHH